MPERQNPPLGLAGVIQRNGNTSTSGARLAAGSYRKSIEYSTLLPMGLLSRFSVRVVSLSLSQTNGKAVALISLSRGP